MASRTEYYIQKLMASKLLKNVDKRAEDLYGRIDAKERMAEYLQDLCPKVLELSTTSEECAENEGRCTINFLKIAEEIIARHDDLYKE